jgi:hypothetical protein
MLSERQYLLIDEWSSLRDKPPIVEGLVPKKEERYNLDEDEQRKYLKINFREHDPIADEYCHYPHCKWAIIEYEGGHLSNSVEQLESTARQLIAANKPVDFAIIVVKKFNDRETELYKRKENILFIKRSNSPVLIPTGNGNKVEVRIYEPNEVENQYKNRNGALSKWQYQ